MGDRNGWSGHRATGSGCSQVSRCRAPGLARRGRSRRRAARGRGSGGGPQGAPRGEGCAIRGCGRDSGCAPRPPLRPPIKLSRGSAAPAVRSAPEPSGSGFRPRPPTHPSFRWRTLGTEPDGGAGTPRILPPQGTAGPLKHLSCPVVPIFRRCDLCGARNGVPPRNLAIEEVSSLSLPSSFRF